MRKKVFVINKASHDFSAAKKYGKLEYLSREPINRYATNHIFRLFLPKLMKAHEDDYILITSLNTMNIVACGIMIARFGKLNILIHRSKDNDYAERIIDFKDILQED